MRMEAEAQLRAARIEYSIADYDRKLLEKHSGAVFVSNRLLPGYDELILSALLADASDAVKILHPYPTRPPLAWRKWAIRPLRSKLEDRFLRINFAKKVQRELESGGRVGLALDFSDNPIGDLGKNLLRPQILRQLRKTGGPIVPIHLIAENFPATAYLRQAIPFIPLIPAAEPIRVSVRVGTPIGAEEMGFFRRNRRWGRYLQAKIFSLGSSFEVKPELFEPAPGQKAPQPIAEPMAQDLIEQDIAALKPEYKAASRGVFDIIIAPFNALPHVMFEIGRLRELTFRAAGEGSGLSRDMDEYDLHYLQLIIWDREARRIVGGYRLGQGNLILKRFGIDGFYISSLFKLKPGFYPILEHAVELGRSYVVPDYQKQRLPLFLLWKGILHFLLANPHYRYLYGPVSISKYYSDVSKGVIVAFVKHFFFDHTLARLVRPRKPFRVKTQSVDTKLLAESMRGEFDVLDHFVENIEPAHFNVPVLFRQYLRQNARFIAFNVDPHFADCLDGLMILDIQHLPAGTLEALQQER